MKEGGGGEKETNQEGGRRGRILYQIKREERDLEIDKKVDGVPLLVDVMK